jgi:hypothetical protein
MDGYTMSALFLIAFSIGAYVYVRLSERRRTPKQ